MDQSYMLLLGKFTKKDLLEFYNGEEIKEKYKSLEKSIQDLINNR